jgi:hypothetical protein
VWDLTTSSRRIQALAHDWMDPYANYALVKKAAPFV